MPRLLMYGMLSSTRNSMCGNLVKAQCVICGAKYGSIDDAKKCEIEHVKDAIKREIEDYTGR